MADLENKIIFKIDHKNPVELVDLSDSLNSFGEQYKKFVLTYSTNDDVRDAKLYVKEVRNGSIIVELLDLLPLALLADANILIQFSFHIRRIYDYFLGKEKEKPAMDKTDYEQCSNILNPVAKDSAAQINISVVHNHKTENIINLNYVSANAVQNAMSREAAMIQEPQHNIHPKVLMYWHQAKNDPSATTGDKAIIETITRRPTKVIFADDSMKAKILSDSHNFFRQAYVVDVAVETINSIPTVYKILSVHEAFDREVPPKS